jgi:hypothetical protein
LSGNRSNKREIMLQVLDLVILSPGLVPKTTSSLEVFRSRLSKARATKHLSDLSAHHKKSTK